MFIYLFQIHGTYRRKDRIYREDIFYGKGKSFVDVNVDELKEDLKERESENPKAYRGNKSHYKLSRKELRKFDLCS